jgi:hypothetical protein
MSKENTTSSVGVGFLDLLTLLFIGLKLTNHITWSWFWVLSPFLIPVGILGVVLLAALTYDLITYLKRARR